MQQLLNWLSAHWESVASCAVLVISAIVTIVASVKKGQVSVLNAINDTLPQLIKYAENLYPQGNGSKKLVVVLEYVHKFLQYTFGLKANEVTKYDEYITRKVELILSTPEKKEVKD